MPGHEILRREAATARGRLYPSTVLYSAYGFSVLVWALGRPGHRLLALAFFALGATAWTAFEYWVHRFVLHGRFPDGPGAYQHFLHVRFDPLHWEHHERPWDGKHINGRIQDTVLFAAMFVAVAAFFPIWSAPVMIAGFLLAYIAEEWVHHSVHFYHFSNPYFRYIKRHHLYHHSPKGEGVGYGLTNGFWDIVFSTRIPAEQRRRLYARASGAVRPAAAASPPSDTPASAGPARLA
jgi:sterol desaturase/sphingolipid hydroxylase (fatty acid hydroxylase superfamily)